MRWSHRARLAVPPQWRARGRATLRLVAATYLLSVWLDGVGSGFPALVLPRTADYFVHVAALFPWAALASIDYRAEGFDCDERAWRELDTRPYFPINSDDKENRFNRVMHFFRENRTTMTSLETYLVEAHNSGKHDDAIPRDHAIGGVRLSSLRVPIPAPGDRLERVTRQPLSAYPQEQRKAFYHTPGSKLTARCGTRGGGSD